MIWTGFKSHFIQWFVVKPQQANAKATSLYWVHSISSQPATPSESDFANDTTRNWVQNPFCRNFASEFPFAFALVWLHHYSLELKIHAATFKSMRAVCWSQYWNMQSSDSFEANTTSKFTASCLCYESITWITKITFATETEIVQLLAKTQWFSTYEVKSQSDVYWLG